VKNKNYFNYIISNLFYIKQREYKMITGEKISQQEEIEFLKLYKNDNNNSDALNKIVLNNVDLVETIVKMYMRNNKYAQSLYDDLMSEGLLGLIIGIQKFDLLRNVSLRTYVAHWVKCKIRRYFIKNKLIPTPNNYQKLKKELLNEKKNLLETLGREPTINEIINQEKFNHYRKSTLKGLLTTTNDIISIDNENVYLQLISPSSYLVFEDIDYKKYMISNILFLSEKEQYIINQRFFHNETLEKIAKTLNKSRERIRQIEEASLLKLRKRMLVI